MSEKTVFLWNRLVSSAKRLAVRECTQLAMAVRLRHGVRGVEDLVASGSQLIWTLAHQTLRRWYNRGLIPCRRFLEAWFGIGKCYQVWAQLWATAAKNVLRGKKSSNVEFQIVLDSICQWLWSVLDWFLSFKCIWNIQNVWVWRGTQTCFLTHMAVIRKQHDWLFGLTAMYYCGWNTWTSCVWGCHVLSVSAWMNQFYCFLFLIILTCKKVIVPPTPFM